MRILIVGDQHFKFQLPYASSFEDGRKGEWDNMKKFIHDLSEEKACDAVVLLGDNLNGRHNHSSVNREFVEFLSGFGDKDVHVIAGNHERYSKETALDFLHGVGNKRWHIYTEGIRVAEIGDIKATFMPYLTPGLLGKKTNEEGVEQVWNVFKSQPDTDVLFLHHAVLGTKWSNGSAEHMNEIVLDKEKLERKFGWIFGGHIHEPQNLSEKTWVTGSIFTSEVGEHEKFVYVLDTTAKKVEKIRLPIRGIYLVYVDSTKNLSFKNIPDNSIVKLVVTDKSINVDEVREAAKRFDASLIIESYPSDRTKVRVEEASGLDLSLNGLLKVYCENKGLKYEDLKEAFDSLEHHSI